MESIKGLEVPQTILSQEFNIEAEPHKHTRDKQQSEKFFGRDGKVKDDKI